MYSADLDDVRKQLQLALQKFARITAIKNLISLDQGDVLVSESGNIRLVLDVDRSFKEPIAYFLTKSVDQELKIESALVKKIDVRRVRSIVVRRSGNPLRLLSKEVVRMNSDSILLKNIEALVGMGKLGQDLDIKFGIQRESNDPVMLNAFIRERDGLIMSFGPRAPKDGECKIGLKFNYQNSPVEEHVREANFYFHTPVLVRDQISAACMIANALQNIVNLEQASGYLKSILGPEKQMSAA